MSLVLTLPKGKGHSDSCCSLQQLLEKTRKEVMQPDLAGEKEAYEVQARSARKAETQAARAAERAAKEETRRAAELREYKGVMKEANMTSNKELASKYKTVEEYEDDFM
ncbi:hypothetical protein QJQ45_021271 [Haematococcus lacustris]|nr:hypothetical protein QJQ45_021271 [Haematococcus lacustris]